MRISLIYVKLLEIIAVEYLPELIENYPEMCAFLVRKDDNSFLDLIKDNKNGVIFAHSRKTLRATNYTYDEVYLIVPKLLKDIYTNLVVLKEFDFKIPFDFAE